MIYSYKPKGTCSTQMNFDISEDGVIQDVSIERGCPGNLLGIRALIIGMKTDDVINKLEGIRCGRKNTSCPDQIAQALKLYNQAHQ